MLKIGIFAMSVYWQAVPLVIAIPSDFIWLFTDNVINQVDTSNAKRRFMIRKALRRYM
jgi:hypothetical protein